MKKGDFDDRRCVIVLEWKMQLDRRLNVIVDLNGLNGDKRQDLEPIYILLEVVSKIYL